MSPSSVLASTLLWVVFVQLLLGHHQEVRAFRSAARLSTRGVSASSLRTRTTTRNSSAMFGARRTILLERDAVIEDHSYDPLGLASSHSLHGKDSNHRRVRPMMEIEKNSNKHQTSNNKALWASSVALAPVLLAEKANAVDSIISQEVYNPATFQPVCPTSDGFYRFLQSGIETVVGKEKFIEYGPLIAGGLLRVRLELCVVESFFNEAVGPFIKENGVSWILPLHETVETFLAGSIFALATTFILVGSTKLLTVITTYFDLLVRIFFEGCIVCGLERKLSRSFHVDL